MRQLILLTLSIALTGCATESTGYYTQSVESWRGGNVKNLVSVWGRPYNTMQSSNGNISYLYKSQSIARTNNGYSPGIGVHPRNGGAAIIASSPSINTGMGRGFSSYCLTTFTATPKGKIVDVDMQGSKCYASEQNAKQLANPETGK